METKEIKVDWFSDADMSAWDSFVEQHPEHTPYHKFAWVQAVKQAYCHDIKALVARIDDEIVGVLAFVEMGMFGKKQNCSLPFCDLGGMLALDQAVENAIVEFLREQGLVVEARERGNLIESEDETGVKVSMLLPLPDTSDALFASFKSKLRSQVRKAEKNGLSYELGTDAKFVDEFYHILSLNMHRLGSPVHSKQWFESVLAYYEIGRAHV